MAAVDPDKTITSTNAGPQPASAPSADALATSSSRYDNLPLLLRPRPPKSPEYTLEELSSIPPLQALPAALIPGRYPGPLPPKFAVGYPVTATQMAAWFDAYDPVHPQRRIASGPCMSPNTISRACIALVRVCGCPVNVVMVVNHPGEHIISVGDNYHLERTNQLVKTTHIRKLQNALGVRSDEKPKWYLSMSHCEWRHAPPGFELAQLATKLNIPKALLRSALCAPPRAQSGPDYDRLPLLLRPQPPKAPEYTLEELSSIPPMQDLPAELIPRRYPGPLPPKFAVGYPVTATQMAAWSDAYDPVHPQRRIASGPCMSPNTISRACIALVRVCGCPVEVVMVVNHPGEHIVSFGNNYRLEQTSRLVKKTHIRKLQEALGVRSDEKPQWYLVMAECEWR